MGRIIIQEETTKNPLTVIGKFAGICYGSDTTNDEKNLKRGKNNVASGHGRNLEFPQVYIELEGYSAKVMREWYTHIGGSPTRMQESTRYISYDNFDFVIPPTIEKDERAKQFYVNYMKECANKYDALISIGIPKEDASYILPFGMVSKVVTRTNARHILDMAQQRLCARALWEYRELMHDLKEALSNYSEEWKFLMDNYFKCKCDISGYCTEERSCGRMPKKVEE